MILHRLCLGKKISYNDICNLYVHYDYAGITRVEHLETDGFCENDYSYISGYCELLEDDVICIYLKDEKSIIENKINNYY